MYSGRRLYLGKSCCIRAKMVVFGQNLLYLGKMVVLGKSGCILSKWLYSGKVVIFGEKCI